MTAHAPNAVHPAAASIAAAMRSRLGNRPVKAAPRADGALLKLTALIVGLAMAGTAAAWWGIEIAPDRSSQSVIARVGPVVMAVPRTLSGPVPEGGQQVVGLVRLRLAWPSLGPSPLDARQLIHVTVTPPDPVNDPANQLAMMARFLTPIAWSNAGGLVARSFRPGSPFENDELYISQPDGQAFSARCPSQTTPDALDELCRTTVRHRGVDLAIRFPREVLPEWERLISGVRQLIDTMLR